MSRIIRVGDFVITASQVEEAHIEVSDNRYVLFVQRKGGKSIVMNFYNEKSKAVADLDRIVAASESNSDELEELRKRVTALESAKKSRN